MGIQVIGHTSFLGHTGYNAHSRNFFTNLNNYIPTRVRNYTYVEDLSYLRPEERKILPEKNEHLFDPPLDMINKIFNLNPNDLIVNLVLLESHHYYFYDKYKSPLIFYNVWESTKQIPEFFERMLCFTGDTKISLLNGEEKKIKDLVNEKTFYVYSYDFYTNKIVPGRGHSCRKTGEKVPVLKITLDNGKVIKCTPDHKFLLRNGRYVEANKLKIGSSLMPLYRRTDDNGYEEIYHPNKTWEKTHKVVSNWKYGENFNKRNTVHHKTFNKNDNSPTSLMLMRFKDHWEYHVNNVKKINNIRINNGTFNLTSEYAQYRSSINDLPSQRLAGTGEHHWSIDSKNGIHPSQLSSERGENYFQSDNHKKECSYRIKKRNINGNTQKSIIYKQLKEMTNDNVFINQDNWNSSTYMKTGKIRWENIPKYIPDFLENNNHKIINIEFYGYEDVYDFTVDTYHNFALSSGVFVHNCADQFWCPTHAQKQWTIDQGYPEHRVKVVPEGVNGEIFCPPKKSKSISEKKKLFEKYSISYEDFTFMIFGRWDYRKSTTEMVQAFCEEFKYDDKVTLILSADNPFSSDGMETTEQRLKHYKFPTDKIKVVHFPPREDYIKFLQHGNCLLGCSRSEGWNLPLMEALACGTPSVASNWGGHLEFADGIAHLVNVPKELPPKEIYFMDTTLDYGVWGEPDFDHLKKVMRDVYNDYGDVKKNALHKSKYIRETYTWDNAAKIAETHIEELCKKTISTPKIQTSTITFNTSFELVDETPRVTFATSSIFKGKVFVVIESENGEHHHESWFDIQSGLNYWIALNSVSNKIKFEVFNSSLDLLYSETKLVKDITNIREEAKPTGGMELYQDQIVNGEVIIKGKRECASRYEAMRKLFNEYKRPFTILDIGANFGYYSIRTTTDYDAVSVMVENKDEEVKTLVNLCDENDCKDKLIVLKTTMDIEKLEELNKCEHFDVVLALNVIHHFPKDKIEEVCHLFTKLGDNLILETPPLGDHGACGYESLDTILNYFDEKQGVKLGSFKRHTSETFSDMVWYQTNHDSLKWPYYGYEKLFENKKLDVERLKDRSPSIITSDFNSKKILTRGDDRVWISGINLRTYLELNGQYPVVTDIIEDIKNRNITTEYKWDDTNNDLTTHNLILNGSTIHMIDFDDKIIEQPLNGDDFYINFTINDIKKYSQEKKSENKLKVNLGCGNDILPGYINVDRYNNTGNVDYQWDISKLEVEDNSLDEIFISHVFEHISLNDIHAVVEEWKRALKPNGELVMRLPNLEHEVNLWLNTPDEDKWDVVSGIFGGQGFTGNFHYQGFNPGSLKAFLERFDFEILDLYETHKRHGCEINIRARKIPNIKKLDVAYTTHYVDGPFAEVIGPPEVKDFFITDFYDVDNNSNIHQATIKVNHWIRTHRKYFTNWLIQIRRNGKIEHEHQMDLKGKKVLISFDTKSLGDTIAWIPVVEEFRKKHQCEVWASTFWNKLFDKCEEYKDLKWTPPGSVVHNLYASYAIGCFDGNVNKNKNEWRLVSLQQIAADFLGIELKEELPANIITQGRRKRVTEEPYVAISEHSTFQCKYWNHPGGWQEVVNYLNDIGYKVVVISKEKTKLKKIINRTNRTMAETINTIKNAEFFIGVSSGPAWLAWALKTPTVMISGCTEEWLEFKNKNHRVINEDVCHGCLNNIEHSFDRGDWNYCPRHKGTLREFECTKRITPNMVKRTINGVMDIKVNESEEYFYFPPDNEIKNLKDETKDFTWETFQQFPVGNTIYHEVFVQEDYKYEGCKIEKGDVVVDIGANVGIFTRYAYVNGAEKILSFEPEKKNFDYLLKNKPEICSAFNLAVSDNNDKQNLCVKELEGSHSLLFDSVKNPNLRKIQCITIDKMFETYQLDKIDFLKMDIEGGELKAFNGITDENLSKIRKISIEYHHMIFKLDNNIREEFIKRFVRLGFKIYILHLRDDYLNMLYFWK